MFVLNEAYKAVQGNDSIDFTVFLGIVTAIIIGFAIWAVISVLEKGDRMAEIELTLDSPITEEQLDAIVDVDFDHTNRIWFHTKHGKQVEFIKAKPVTSNADRIRAMSDEELAGAFLSGCGGRECPKCYYSLGPYHQDTILKQCRQCWLDWLKQEVDSDPT